MKSAYFVTLNIKTLDGFETFGRFEIGNEIKEAKEIFNLLKGDDHLPKLPGLSMDLNEEFKGVSLTIKILDCTLDELADNVKIISREIFKRSNFKRGIFEG
jgi:hypothetical protein